MNSQVLDQNAHHRANFVKSAALSALALLVVIVGSAVFHATSTSDTYPANLARVESRVPLWLVAAVLVMGGLTLLIGMALRIAAMIRPGFRPWHTPTLVAASGASLVIASRLMHSSWTKWMSEAQNGGFNLSFYDAAGGLESTLNLAFLFGAVAAATGIVWLVVRAIKAASVRIPTPTTDA